MEKGWTKVFVTAEDYLVSMASDILQDNGIESVVINHKDSSYVMWGEAEIYVRDENEMQAIGILEQLKKG